MSNPRISVVIPVGPAEQGLSPMLEQLPLLQDVVEIIFVFCPESVSLQQELSTVTMGNVCSMVTEKGRAIQMNRAAESCQGDFIWFLHLDSRFGEVQWQRLKNNIKDHPDDLHYFDLQFETDGAGPIWLNAGAANLRSRWLGLPFGDQGFCISKEHFIGLKGYPVDAPYGEDHLFVWRAHQAGIGLKNTGTYLLTSARKYSSTGWLRLTLRYQYYWISQALPQLWRLLGIKLGRAL